MPRILPAINQNVCFEWTEAQRDLYHAMPFFLVNKQVRRRKNWLTWPKVCGSIKWTPNMGEIMKMVRKEPSPVMRQQAFPNALSTRAKKDVMDVQETSVTTSIKHHKFESPIFQFYPSFRDFMKNHVEVHGTDIMEKQEIFENVFARAHIFHQSPYVYLCGAAAPHIAAPMGDGNDAGTSGKTTAFLQAQLPLVLENLSLVNIDNALNIFSDDMGVPPYSNEVNPELVSTQGVNEKWILFTSADAYNQFKYDAWLKDNKSIDLNIVTEGFKGNLFGQVTCKLERFPLRIARDGTFPAPQIRILGDSHNNVAAEADPYNTGESVPNPDYVKAEYEVAFLVGDRGYDLVEVGPPPSAFAGKAQPKGFENMKWNGEVILTSNFLIPCVQDDGTTTWETNDYGEYVRFISHATYGIVGLQRRNVLPIFFKRSRGPQD